MGLFDQIKQKSMEKMMQAAMSSGALEGMLKKMPGVKDSEISEVMQTLKGEDLGKIMDVLKTAGPDKPVTVEQVRTLFTPEMFSVLSSKLGVPAHQAPEKVAQMINQMMDQLRRGS